MMNPIIALIQKSLPKGLTIRTVGDGLGFVSILVSEGMDKNMANRGPHHYISGYYILHPSTGEERDKQREEELLKAQDILKTYKFPINNP